jgi:hypothetical protein
MRSTRDQLQLLAQVVCDQLEEFDEYDDVYCSDRVVGFGYAGTQYALCFLFDGMTGYYAVVDNYKTKTKIPAIAVGRMLRGDFSDIETILVPTLRDTRKYSC